MPRTANRPCCYPGCRDFSTGRGYCDKHRKQNQEIDRNLRGSSHERGYDHRWRKARAVFLRCNPLCVGPACAGAGLITPATVVDHIIPHKGDKALFWDETNWQPMCASCHSAKTAGEDMGAWRPGQRGPGGA